jgi:hypothetical protein
LLKEVEEDGRGPRSLPPEISGLGPVRGKIVKHNMPAWILESGCRRVTIIAVAVALTTEQLQVIPFGPRKLWAVPSVVCGRVDGWVTELMVSNSLRPRELRFMLSVFCFQYFVFSVVMEFMAAACLKYKVAACQKN